MTQSVYHLTVAATVIIAAMANACSKKSPPPTAGDGAQTDIPTTQAADQPTGEPVTSAVATTAPSEKKASTRPLSVSGLTFKIPAGWQSVEPKSKMRLLQFDLPGDDGPVEVVITCFGKGHGGSRQANLIRWVHQFENPVDSQKYAPHQKSKFGTEFLDCLIVTCQGIYAPKPMGPNPPTATPKPNYALHAVMIENGPFGSVFVTTIGPQSTLDAHKKELNQFARSVRLAD